MPREGFRSRLQFGISGVLCRLWVRASTVNLHHGNFNFDAENNSKVNGSGQECPPHFRGAFDSTDRA